MFFIKNNTTPLKSISYIVKFFFTFLKKTVDNIDLKN